MSEHIQISENQDVFVYLKGGHLKRIVINTLSRKICNGGSSCVLLGKFATELLSNSHLTLQNQLVQVESTPTIFIRGDSEEKHMPGLK